MNEKYEIASIKLQDMPLVPGSNAARKAILKHEANEDDLTDRYYAWLRESWDIIRQDIMVDQAKHSAKLKIDELGCEAAAYTVMMAVLTGGIPETPPRMYFILNRPFLFVLMGKGNLPLFIGIVNEPNTAIS